MSIRYIRLGNYFGMEYTHWGILRRLANCRLVTTSYVWIFIVPPVVTLLSPFAGPRDITLPWLFGESTTIPINLTLPFSWELFFLMALCFALGRLLFEIFCPRIIKEHPTFGEYRSAHTGNRRFLENVRDLIKNTDIHGLYQLVERVAISDVHFQNKPEGLMDCPTLEAAREKCFDFCVSCTYDEDEPADEILLGDVYYQVTEFATTERRRSNRWTAVILYIGVLLLLLVLAQNIYKVAEYWLTDADVSSVYQVCGECDLDKQEVDAIIDGVGHAALTRTEKMDLFRGQFENAADAEYWEARPCHFASHCVASVPRIPRITQPTIHANFSTRSDHRVLRSLPSLRRSSVARTSTSTTASC